MKIININLQEVSPSTVRGSYRVVAASEANARHCVLSSFNPTTANGCGCA